MGWTMVQEREQTDVATHRDELRRIAMPAYDASNKLLFSHPEMVAGMLELGVGQQWVRQADLSKLKPVAGGQVSEKLVKRRGDQVWKAERPGGPVYILLEFQSTPDRTMGVRLPTYGGLLAQRLMREEKSSEGSHLGPLFEAVSLCQRCSVKAESSLESRPMVSWSWFRSP